MWGPTVVGIVLDMVNDTNILIIRVLLLKLFGVMLGTPSSE